MQIGLVLVGILSLTSVIRPFVAIVSILAFGLFGPFIPGFTEIRGLSIISIAGAIGAFRYWSKMEVRMWHQLWPVSFLALFVVNMIVSDQPLPNYLYLLLGAICVYYLTVYAIQEPSQIKIIVYTAIVVGVCAAIVSFLDYHLGSTFMPADAGRLHEMERSVVDNPNYLFPFVLPGLFFAMLIYFTTFSVAEKSLMVINIGIMVLGSLSTLSRGTTVGLVCILLVILLIQVRHKAGHLTTLVALLTMVGLGVYFIFPDFLSLLLQRSEHTREFLPGGRLFLEQIGFGQFISSPIFGVGLGATAERYGITHHDGYIALLSETGLLGFALFYSLPFSLLVKLIRLTSASKTKTEQVPFSVYSVLQGFIVGILIYNFFNVIVYLKTVFLMIAIIQRFVWINGRNNVVSDPVVEFFLGKKNQQAIFQQDRA